ncbi:5'-3' exonuclease [Clostridium perfringens]|uniref:5'-3' exonuclease n=2 Tax=Clostridium perfringens TaxID=1502 RepID=UPI001570C24E|nr:5'-3' exonuclease H3TH domain-containing protein [Clostridium perfringens]MBI6024444.1 hypothetical protein [Clostridium perfringens]MBI6048573.1 hypothetical protein [Clostridium perfringens]MDK0553681.1 5'-3' exonuclease H3TH domain-containing protein [Clostridium perfringens]MDK0575120.1 5'-3' exonuclease H3TH domain-containing protein [Clostridium perfringens]MDK0834790.1 5'-3' exonuclease H3TH domain-containing protein [Clostridium perfringens]
MKRNKMLLIIDGSSLLSTSFYANSGKYIMAKTDEEKETAAKNLLKSSKGKYTNGVLTFMRTLLKLIENQKPSHMAVVWDRTRNTFRQNIKGCNGTYKGQRKETPEPLKEQFLTTQELLEGIIPQFISKIEDSIIYEADDFAGSLSVRYSNDMPVFLYTKDEDYLALINERVRVFLVTSKANEMYEEYNINPKDYNIPDGVFEYNLELFKEIKGLNEPKEFTEVKAIKGDASDNIPGIKGVGDKAAFPLVKEYGSLENIYDTIENLNKNEEKELRTFLKEYLGISRSPIANMLKNGTIELDNGDKLEYRCISGQLTDEQLEFQELIKDKIDTRFPIELLNSEDKELLVNNKIANIELSAKESAFMSRDLATIATDISDIHNLSLDDVKLDLDKTLLKKRLLELDIKSLL